MNENKLTIKDCMKYPNANLLNRHSGYVFDNIFHYINELKGINEKEFNTTDKYKLILRPLSSLTEEEETILSDEQHKMFPSYKFCIKMGNAIISGYEKWKIDKLREWNINIDFEENDGRFIYESKKAVEA